MARGMQCDVCEKFEPESTGFWWLEVKTTAGGPRISFGGRSSEEHATGVFCSAQCLDKRMDEVAHAAVGRL